MTNPWDERFVLEVCYVRITQGAMLRKHLTVTLKIEERTPVSFDLEDKHILVKAK